MVTFFGIQRNGIFLPPQSPIFRGKPLKFHEKMVTFFQKPEKVIIPGLSPHRTGGSAHHNIQKVYFCTSWKSPIEKK